MNIIRSEGTDVLTCDDDRILVRRACELCGAQVSDHRGYSLGIDIKSENAWHRARKQIWRLDSQVFECGQMLKRELDRSPNSGADCESGRFDRNRASSCHRVDQRLDARIPSREHD